MALPENIVDPGMVNIETQAYPRPLDPSQSLPQQLAALLSASLFAAPRALDPDQAGLVPSANAVASQTFTLPSLSQGVATPAVTEVTVAAQNTLRFPLSIAEFIVTESGSFQTNQTSTSTVRVTARAVAAVTTFVFNGVTYYQVFFVAGTDLFSYGVDFVGTEARFPSSAPAAAPENVPTGLIISYSTTWIIIDGSDFVATGSPYSAPTNNALVDLNIEREGFDVVFDLEPAPIDVVISPAPAIATTTVAQSFGLINAVAGSGVVSPFIGTGLRIPPLLGTFFVERNDVNAQTAPPVRPIIDVFQ